MNSLIFDRMLKVLGAVVFVLWLVCWGYTASKMLEFSSNTLRNVTLLLSILFLNVWTIGFTVAIRKLAPAPTKSAQAAGEKVSPVAQLVPLFFSVFLAALYVLFKAIYQTSHPTWPSPILPTEVCFAPMVFVVAASVWQKGKAAAPVAQPAKKPAKSKKA